MDVSIINVKKATQEEWDKIWETCPYSTFFHSREWAEIWNDYTIGAMKPLPMVVVFSDTKIALLPFSVSSSFKGMIKNYISSPAGTFGGWISANELNHNHSYLLKELIKKNYKNIICRINPYNSHMAEVYKNNGQNDDTQVIKIDKPFAELFKMWTKGHRSAAKKARRDGVSVVKAETLEDWRAYYHLYQDSIRRWGETVTTSYSWDLFKIIYERFSKNITLWLATFDSTIIAGALCLYAKNHIVYWHGAAHADYFKLRPVNLLIYEALMHACANDYKWFDFNPSGGLEGVRKFKNSFGSATVNAPVIRYQNNFLDTIKKYLPPV